MNSNGIQQTAKKVGQVLAKNSPTILTGLSVAGLITTTAMAVQATPKAIQILDDIRLARIEFAEENEHVPWSALLTKREVIRLTWRCYVPTAIMGGLTIGCIIGANSINLRRNAALASVYSITETALKEYQEKVIETFGENKAQKIRDNIAKDKIERDPVNNSEIIITGKGEMLCYEPISGRYFKNDIENIRRIQNDLNRDLLNDAFVSLNDVYYYLGLSTTKIGDDLGWDVDNGLIEFRFSSQLTSDNTPCLVLDYKTEPGYKYMEY